VILPARDHVVDPGIKVIGGQVGAVGFGGGGKAAGNLDPLPPELTNHLAQRAVLATDKGNIAARQVFEPHDVDGFPSHRTLLRDWGTAQVRMRLPFASGLDADQGGSGNPVSRCPDRKEMETQMTKTDILNVMQRVKGASALDGALLAEASDAVRGVFPSLPALSQPVLEPVEEVLHLIDMALPGWSIQLTGKAMEPDGHWRCSLRETRGSDEIEVVGLGTGPAVALALLEAFLDVAQQKHQR
jgi:hypothetical protein